MAIIPTYFARERADTSRLPRAPAWYLANTGQGLEAQAMSGTGQAIGQGANILAAIKRHNLEVEGNSQYDTARRQAREVFNRLYLALEGNRDTSTYDKLYKATTKEAKSFAPKNRLGAQKFQSWLDLRKPEWDMNVEQARRAMVRFNAQDSYIANLAGVADIQDPKKAKAEARALTVGAIDDMIRTPGQAALDYQRTMDSWVKSDIWRRATATVRPDGEVDFSEAVKWFSKAENIKGIDSEVVDRMLENARTQAGLQQGRDNAKLEAQQEIDRDAISKAIRSSDPNALNLIESSYLPEAEQFTWNERLRAHAERAAKGIDIVTDPKVRWETLRMLTKDPGSVTDDYLVDLVGKGLSWDDIEEFKKIRDTEITPLKTPRAQLYFNRLDSLYSDRDTDEEEAYEWDIANEKLMAYFKDNPDATAKQAQEFYNELTDPKKRDLLDRVLNPIGWKGGTVASRIRNWLSSGKKEELPEPKTQAEFEDTVRTLDEEEARKYYDRWKNKWR